MRKNILSLTTGAIVSAISVILIMLSNFSAIAFDSIFFYFVPLPLAIYAYLYDYKWGSISFVVTIIISFLVQTNPINVLVLTIPALLLGFVFGLLKRRVNNIITLSVSFALSIFSSLISLLSLKYVSNLSFIDYNLDSIAIIFQLFNITDEVLIRRIIVILIPSVLIIDSLMKLAMVYISFMVLIKVLRLDDNLRLSVRLKPSIILSIINTFLLVLAGILIPICINNGNLFLSILLSAILVILFVLLIYSLFIFVFYLDKVFILNGKRTLSIVVNIVLILILPISVLLGVIFNYIYRLLPSF